MSTEDIDPRLVDLDTWSTEAALEALQQGQADAVAAAMKRVLDHMLELESYNELVELLRGIVNEHNELREKMQEEQRRKLRDFLDD